ncbi:hypothetical protein VP01_3206g1 [Puccinia sorghi]|uniref:Uncharacterized protein n=1 Tax=Puccinia sorghi TaxID=27349 RepID=A0A0L6UYC4_9BASI|nr:hypothetical protein VP01_3206g1 [Puccinia sorghi]
MGKFFKKVTNNITNPRGLGIMRIEYNLVFRRKLLDVFSIYLVLVVRFAPTYCPHQATPYSRTGVNWAYKPFELCRKFEMKLRSSFSEVVIFIQGILNKIKFRMEELIGLNLIISFFNFHGSQVGLLSTQGMVEGSCCKRVAEKEGAYIEVEGSKVAWLLAVGRYKLPRSGMLDTRVSSIERKALDLGSIPTLFNNLTRSSIESYAMLHVIWEKAMLQILKNSFSGQKATLTVSVAEKNGIKLKIMLHKSGRKKTSAALTRNCMNPFDSGQQTSDTAYSKSSIKFWLKHKKGESNSTNCLASSHEIVEDQLEQDKKKFKIEEKKRKSESRDGNSCCTEEERSNREQDGIYMEEKEEALQKSQAAIQTPHGCICKYLLNHFWIVVGVTTEASWVFLHFNCRQLSKVFFWSDTYFLLAASWGPTSKRKESISMCICSAQVLKAKFASSTKSVLPVNLFPAGFETYGLAGSSMALWGAVEVHVYAHTTEDRQKKKTGKQGGKTIQATLISLIHIDFHQYILRNVHFRRGDFISLVLGTSSSSLSIKKGFLVTECSPPMCIKYSLVSLRKTVRMVSIFLNPQ